jgi:general secretion pathway protein L
MDFGEFFHWWREELAGMLPAGARRRLERRQATLRVSLGADGAVLSCGTNGHLEQLGRVSLEAPGAREIVTGLASELQPESTRVEVIVPPAKLLVKDVQLPLAAEENLHQVLGFEMERQTPFRAEQVYYSYRVSERRPENQQLAVRLSVVPRSVVDPMLSLLDSWRLEPVASVGNGRPDEETRFSFAPGERERRASSSLNRTLVVVNLALLVAVVAIPLIQQRDTIAELRGELDRVRSEARAAADMQDTIDRIRAQSVFLIDAKSKLPAAVELIEELSQRLPDDTWLFRVELRDGKVHVQGTSSAASALIAALEESDYFEDARFASPVTRDGNSGRERFHLSVGVVVRGARSAPEVAEESKT